MLSLYTLFPNPYVIHKRKIGMFLLPQTRLQIQEKGGKRKRKNVEEEEAKEEENNDPSTQ